MKDIDERNNNDISSGDGDGSFNNVGVTYQKNSKTEKISSSMQAVLGHGAVSIGLLKMI